MAGVETQEGQRTAARALRDALAHLSSVGAAAVLKGQFPWIESLSVDDAAAFVADFAAAVDQAADQDDWAELTLTIEQWRESAEIHSDAELYRLLTRPIEHDFGPVPTVGSAAAGGASLALPLIRLAGRARSTARHRRQALLVRRAL